MFLLQTHETFVEFMALCGKYTDGNLYACVAEYLNAATCHFGVGVCTAYYHTSDSLLHYHVGTRGSLAIVAARFKADIEGEILHRPICIMPAAFRVKETINLGMGSAILTVPTFSHYEFLITLPAHKNGTHHRIGGYIVLTETRQLQAAVYVFAIIGFHTSEKNSIFAT